MTVRADRQLPFAFFIIIVLCWLIPGLVGHEAWNPDEGYTFGIIQHIVHSGDVVIPTLAGEPFMEKPPAFFILAAAFIKVLGGFINPPDAARLAAGFYLALAFWAVALTAREVFAKGYGRWAVLVLIGCLGFVTRAHQMITDTALFAGTAWAIYGYVLFLRKPWFSAVILGLASALAFLSKGLLGPGLIGVCGLLLPLAAREFRTWRYLGFLLLALLAFLPLPAIWMGALYHRSPEQFNVWFWVNNIGRFDGTAGLGPKGGHFYYFKLLPWYALPALPMAMFALWLQRGRALSTAWRVPLVFFVGSVAVLSTASDARELYAMPLLPSLAIMAAGAIRFNVMPSRIWRVVLLILTSIMALSIWVIGLALTLGIPEIVADIFTKKAHGWVPHGSILAMLVALVITLVLGAILFNKQEACRRPLVIWTTGFTLTWALAMVLGMPYLDYTKRYAEPFLEIRAFLPKQGCVASTRLGEAQRGLLEYYAGLDTLRTEVDEKAEDRCNYLLIQTETTQPIITPRQGERIWRGARPADPHEWFELYRLR